MTEQEFSLLIKSDKYQVFLFICRASIPFQFAGHSWFVINCKGDIKRFEVLFSKKKIMNESRHLYVDNQTPAQGIDSAPFVSNIFWKSKLIGSIEGGDDSLAAHMSEFIKKSENSYPYRNKYALLGPNSNTYISWIISHFPESGFVLPKRCFGKNFKFGFDKNY